MIIVAKSSNFKQAFPNNCNNDFRISLFKNETFSKNAKLAIREIIVPPIASDTLAYIICSAVIYSQLEEQWRRVIRLLSVQASDKHQYIKFNPPLYFNLLNPDLDFIRISLKNEIDEFIQFKKEETDTTVVLEILQ
jgi:hypothetical protein